MYKFWIWLAAFLTCVVIGSTMIAVFIAPIQSDEIHHKLKDGRTVVCLQTRGFVPSQSCDWDHAYVSQAKPNTGTEQ